MSDLRTRFHPLNDGTLVIESVQDVEPIIEDAKRRHIEGLHGSKDMRHVARIPKVLVEKYCVDNGITLREWIIDPKHVERMLADRDLMHFRVAP